MLEDTSETMLAELHHFLENNFGNLISIRAIQRGSSVIVCNLLNEGTQLFISALQKIGCYIRDVTVSLYTILTMTIIYYYRIKQYSIYQKVSDFTFRLFHIIIKCQI